MGRNRFFSPKVELFRPIFGFHNFYNWPVELSINFLQNLKSFFKCCHLTHLQAFVDVPASRLFVRLLKSLVALTRESGPGHVALAVLPADRRVGPTRVHPLAPLGLLAVYSVGPSALAPVCQEDLITYTVLVG